MRHNISMFGKAILFLALSGTVTAGANAQSFLPLPDAPAPQDTADPASATPAEAATLRNTPRNFMRDQAAIWTSPLRLTEGQAVGAVFFVAAAAGLGAEDRHIMQTHFLNPGSHINTASTGLTGLFIAAPVAFYSMGRLHNNDHARETGILGAEAMLDSLAVDEVVKISSRRERPTADNARGKFFQPGVGFDSSFASNHSVLAWSSAAVIATEYNGWLTKVAAYGLATGVSMSRIVGRDHFPSDVLVGSGVGWMIGRYVVHRHRRMQ